MKYVLLGYGHIGKRHESAIEKLSNSKLIAIIDPAIQNHKNYNVYATIKDCIAQEDFDIAIIATPNGLHFKHAKELITNQKHVVIEKPMTLSSKKAKKLNTLAKTNGVEIFITMQLRFSPIIQWVKNLMNKNTLGKIHLVNVNCFWNRNNDYYFEKEWHGTTKMDGGILYTQFTHFSDIIFHLFGEVKNVNTKLYNFTHQESTEFPDSGTSNFEFKNGGAGSFTFTTATYEKNFESYFTVLAEKGTLKIGGKYMNELLYCNIKNEEIPTFKDEKSNLHFLFHQHVYDVLSHKNKNETSGKDGEKVIEMIEDIYKK